MHEPKAKNVIMLFMEGGPSQVDTFDPKPKLNAMHKSESKRTGTLEQGFKFFVGSPYGSRKVGKSGLDMSDQWVHLPEVADELCNYRGCFAESLNHPGGPLSHEHGQPSGRRPCARGLGELRTGLGQPKPSRIRVMTELALPQGGRATGRTAFFRTVPGHPPPSHRIPYPRPELHPRTRLASISGRL